MNDFYRSELMEIYKNPTHQGCLTKPSVTLEKQNAFCGDHLHLTLQIKDNLIQDAKFDGAMCFVSIIGAELLIEKIIGQNIAEVRKIDQKKLLSLLGLNLSTSRIACATLTLKALQEALDRYEQKSN